MVKCMVKLEMSSVLKINEHEVKELVIKSITHPSYDNGRGNGVCLRNLKLADLRFDMSGKIDPLSAPDVCSKFWKMVCERAEEESRWLMVNFVWRSQQKQIPIVQ